MLRRDRRRAQEAAAQAASEAATQTAAEHAVAAVVVGVAQAAAAAGVSETATEAVADETAPVVESPAEAAETSPAEPSAAVPAAAEPVITETETAAQPDVDETEPTTAASTDESIDEEQPSTEEPASTAAPRPRRGARWRRGASASAATPRTSPVAALAAKVPSRPARRRAGRTTLASFAIATLVAGTALPALGMVQAGIGTASAASSTVDISTQSFTASADIMPDVVVRGDSFSASSPAEVEQAQVLAAATAKSGVAPISSPGHIIVPMAEGTYSMTDGFGASRPGRSHMGQDYAAPVGTPIYAAADGVVSMSQDSYGGYGVTVQVQHVVDGNPVGTLYGHMDYGTRAVAVGDHVVAGQFLGRVGTTGYTIGSCLHFEVRISGAPINPVPWLDANLR